MATNTPYPPVHEAPKTHYWIEYVDDISHASFWTDYRALAPEALEPLAFHVLATAQGCPRCGHPTSDVLPLRLVATSFEASAVELLMPAEFDLGPKRAKEPTHAALTLPGTPGMEGSYGLITCRCMESHYPTADAPAGSKAPGAIGCGSYWIVKAERIADGQDYVIRAAEKDVAYRIWVAAQAAELATSTSLTTVQANATKWQAGLTAILGLLGVTTLVGGRAALAPLPLYAQIVIAVLTALSLASNVRSIYRFELASAGRTTLASSTTTTLEMADLQPLEQASDAQSQFNSAIRLAAGSFIFGLLAVLAVWFFPASPSPSLNVTLTIGTTSRTVCGTIAIDAAKQTFTVTPKDATDVAPTFPLRLLESIGGTC